MRIPVTSAIQDLEEDSQGLVQSATVQCGWRALWPALLKSNSSDWPTSGQWQRSSGPDLSRFLLALIPYTYCSIYSNQHKEGGISRLFLTSPKSQGQATAYPRILVASCDSTCYHPFVYALFMELFHTVCIYDFYRSHVYVIPCLPMNETFSGSP